MIKRKYVIRLMMVSWLFAISAIALSLSNSKSSALGDCSLGYKVQPTSIVQNGNFATSPGDVWPLGSNGTSAVTPGNYYSGGSFYSQMANVGDYRYANQVLQVSPLIYANSFSIQSGNINYTDTGSPDNQSISNVNQFDFPGDATNSISASNTYIYMNGNMLGGGTEYLLWEQDVTGLTVGTEYVFHTYVSNTLEGVNVDDPVITLKIGGTTALPDGTSIVGPVSIDEASTSNTSALDGWQRVAFNFTATATTEKLKVIDSAVSDNGDDFAMTATGLSECVPLPDLTPTIAAVGEPVLGSSIPVTVTVTNVSPTTTTNDSTISILLPEGTSVNGGAAGPVTITGNNAGNWVCQSNADNPNQVIVCETSTLIVNGDPGKQEFNFDLDISANTTETEFPLAIVVGNIDDENPVNDENQDQFVLGAITPAPAPKTPNTGLLSDRKSYISIAAVVTIMAFVIKKRLQLHNNR
jgi:hypothetical protein